MKRIEINIQRKNCAPRWFYLQDYTSMHGQQNIKNNTLQFIRTYFSHNVEFHLKVWFRNMKHCDQESPAVFCQSDLLVRTLCKHCVFYILRVCDFIVQSTS
jgi:hypothetical protein